MGQSSDMAKIPPTPRVYGVMLGVISFCVPTARVALVVDVSTRFVEFTGGWQVLLTQVTVKMTLHTSLERCLKWI